MCDRRYDPPDNWPSIDYGPTGENMGAGFITPEQMAKIKAERDAFYAKLKVPVETPYEWGTLDYWHRMARMLPEVTAILKKANDEAAK